MKKLIKSFLYAIPLLILGIFLISSDFLDMNSDRSNISEKEISADSNIRINKLRLVDGYKSPDLIKIQPVSELMASLAVIPSSHDYGGWYCGHSVTYGFQIKNTGGTNVSGSVYIYGGLPFSCTNGCSFSLSPGQSQNAYVKFEPFQEGDANGTLIAGYGGTASLTGEGIVLYPEEMYPDSTGCQPLD